MVKGIKIIDDETYDRIIHMVNEIRENNHYALSRLIDNKQEHAEHLISHNSSNIARLLDILIMDEK